MEQKDLIELKRKISRLNELENQKRDKYLKKIADGTLQGPTTGYSSIDKLWLKYYDLNNTVLKPKKTVYQELIDNNKDHLDDLAIEYFGAKISFRKLLMNIDKTSKSFEKNGIKKGDFVTICAPGIPETVYCFYALSKLGAVANMIAPHFDKNDFVERIADCQSKLLIIMDEFYDEIKESVEKSIIDKVVIVPSLNSSPLRFLNKKNKYRNKNEIYWNSFIREGHSVNETVTINYELNMPLTMVYSSGTTGASKGILLSNDSFQNSVNSYFESGLDITRGQKFYQIIPTWYSTGISTSVHLPLTCGASIYMDPRFERNVFAKNIIKAKPNYCVAPTSMYEGLLDNKILKNNDLSYFSNAFEGGEPLSKELAQRINKVFSEHNNSSSIKVGYGQCECGATITTQTDNTDHCNGSVGIPLPNINVQICNSNLEELMTGMRGQIVVDTPSSMLGYYKNSAASKDYFYIDEFGKKWNCTGDIGYMDKNGNLYIDGRANDYSMVNGEFIYNFDIEKIINNIPGVKLCDVLSRKIKENYDQLIAHIILEENIEKAEQKRILLEIQSKIYESTHNINMVPLIFKIWKEFPYAKSGKRDIQKMKNENNDFIYLDFEKIKVLVRK